MILPITLTLAQNLSDSENTAETKRPVNLVPFCKGGQVFASRENGDNFVRICNRVKFLVTREMGQFCYTTMVAAALQWSLFFFFCNKNYYNTNLNKISSMAEIKIVMVSPFGMGHPKFEKQRSST